MRTENEIFYQAYRYCLDSAIRLMLHANTDDQMVYVNLAHESLWEYDEIITAWAGNDLISMDKGARVASPEDLWIEKRSPQSGPSVDPDEVIGSIVCLDGEKDTQFASELLAEGLEIKISDKPTYAIDNRFYIWASMLNIANKALEEYAGENPLYFSTGFHGGWGTYYLEFRLMGKDDFLYAISEEGHFAGIPDKSIRKALDEFNLRQLVLDNEPTDSAVIKLVKACQIAHPLTRQ